MKRPDDYEFAMSLIGAAPEERLRKYIEHLETLKQDMIQALVADCESGVKWLNESCLAKFKADYPNLSGTLFDENV